MGLLLSILITCVGVLEVIACYTHFRVGVAYNECKSNIRDIAKYYALELRKHELHFEPGPDDGGGEGTSQETLSELVRKRIRSTIRVQEKSHNGQIAHTARNGHALGASCSNTPDQTETPNYSNLLVPRNSISGLDSPTVQTLMSPDVNITEAVTEKIHRLESTESWGRKSPSPFPEKTGLEVVEKNFWRSRSPSPFPEINGESLELNYTPGLRQHRAASPLLDSLATINGNLQRSPSGSELVDKDYWNNTSISDDAYTKSDLEIQDILPPETARSYSITDLEVQNLTRGLDPVPRHPSPTPNPEILFGMTNDEESKFDEEFLRSLDGVKISKCDDRRRSFRKKRNSSSTSSRASREDLRSITSLEDIETSEKKEDLIPPLAEEDIETIVSEKCESLKSPPPAQSKDDVKVTQQEQTHFKASESTSTSDINKPTNLSFTEKVKDLEINVQLLVTVKGTSQGDQMQYTTSVAQQQTKPLEPVSKQDDNTITKSTEEKSEFGKVKTSITYGQANTPDVQKSIAGENLKPIDKINDLKDLQISSQSLIHAERAVQDNVKSSEDEFMKLYESFTELPPREKDKFLKIIEKSSKDHKDETVTHNLENPPAETENNQTSNKQNQNVIKMQQQTANTDVGQESNTKEEQSAIEENVTDPNNKEIILLKEITEITERTETVMKLPPATKQSQSIIPEQTTENISKSNISLNEQHLKTSDTTETKICDLDKSESTTIVQQSETSNEISDNVDNKLENNNFIPQEEQISNETVNEEIRTTTITSSKPEETQDTQIKEESKTTVIEDQKTDAPKVDSSSSSSETPTTVVANVLRRASKTAFEDATEIQNQEMIKRRVSNSEISPKQATQAFWVMEGLKTIWLV